MKLTYIDGTIADDRLFDESLELQRLYVARAMNLDPSTPEDWPVSTIDKLLSLRKHEGEQKFFREVGRLMSPNFR